jgi:hypothetical protein
MRILQILVLSMLAMSVTPTHADERAKDVESFMEEYLSLWNAGDSTAITEKIYRFDAPNALSTREGLQAEFDRLKAAGYSHSEKISINACFINATQALVELRYRRLKTDGTAMPPRDRSTLYFVKKTTDGLRINQLLPMNATAKLNCSSYTDSAEAS